MTLDVPVAALLAVALASIRAAAWLVISPPFDSKIIPTQVKALLSVGFVLPIAPGLAGEVAGLGQAELFLSAAEQVLVGAALGFVTSLLFAAFQAAGDLIDLFGGLTLAFAFDPFSASQSSVFGRFYHLLAITLLFATNGYQLVLRGFLASYHAVPLSGVLSLAALGHVLTVGLAQMFLAALQIAGPLVAVLFCADIALGLLNKVAPSLNAFALGFPIKILLTLVLGGTAILILPAAVRETVDQAVQAVLAVSGR